MKAQRERRARQLDRLRRHGIPISDRLLVSFATVEKLDQWFGRLPDYQSLRPALCTDGDEREQLLYRVPAKLVGLISQGLVQGERQLAQQRKALEAEQMLQRVLR